MKGLHKILLIYINVLLLQVADTHHHRSMVVADVVDRDEDALAVLLAASLIKITLMTE